MRWDVSGTYAGSRAERTGVPERMSEDGEGPRTEPASVGHRRVRARDEAVG